MTGWHAVEDAVAGDAWNAWLGSMADASPYQAFEWGEYRLRECGGRPLRLVARDRAGAVVAMFQGTLRRALPGVAIVTSLGGPVGRLDDTLATLPAAILRACGARRGFITIAPRRMATASDAAMLTRCGWRPTGRASRTPLTMSLDLAPGLDALLAGASGNWRHSLRRAWKREVAVERWHDASPDAVVRVLEAMSEVKSIAVPFTSAELAALFASFGDRLLLYRARDVDGATLSVRGCLLGGHAALDFIAATNAAGRRTYASYAVLWALLAGCVDRGVRFYDLNEIDPAGNPGVHDFKRGTGATAFEYLGPWEWASSATLLAGAAFARRLRHWRERPRSSAAASTSNPGAA